MAVALRNETLRLSHGVVAYRAGGAGPSMLLLPGLGGTHFTWRRNLPVLGRFFTCYALDLPGIGNSDPLAGERSGLDALAEALAEVAAALHLEPAVVVASSWGGAIALTFAARFPQQVARLVLAAPVHPFFRPNWFQRLMLFPPSPRLVCAFGARFPALHRPLFARMYGDASRITPETVPGYLEPLCRRATGAAIAAYVRGWRASFARLRQLLPRVAAPALLVWGERDAAVPLATAEALRRALPRAELSVIGGAGHLPFEELPDDFHRAVLAFALPRRGS